MFFCACAQINQCIEVLDKDGDGEVSYAEFMELVKAPVKKAVNVISAANAFGGALFPSSSSCRSVREETGIISTGKMCLVAADGVLVGCLSRHSWCA